MSWYGQAVSGYIIRSACVAVHPCTSSTLHNALHWTHGMILQDKGKEHNTQGAQLHTGRCAGGAPSRR